MHSMSETSIGTPTGFRRSPALVQRIRFQLGGGILVGAVLPGLYRWQDDVLAMNNAAFLNALSGAAMAIAAGFFLQRRLGNYPGVNAGSSIPMAYTGAFLAMMLVFFFGRFDYSRFVFVSGYFIALVWYTGLHVLTAHGNRPRLAVIPGGHADTLAFLPGASWLVLDKPRLPVSDLAGLAADLRHGLAPEWERFVADCALAGIPVYHSKQLSESITGKVAVEHLSENAFGTLVPDLLYLRAKRLGDLVLAIAALPLFLLLLAVVGPLIKATSGGPVFFRQERMGLGGKIFRVFKFRTMFCAPVIDTVGDAVAPGGRRITPIGRFLRKHRIDETPQILNILLGQMSWVGPRPEALTLSKWYENELPFYRYRHVVPPGITGWAQVNQGHVAHPSQVLQKLHYDFFYIKNLSPWLDLLIALKTVRIVLSGAGAR